MKWILHKFKKKLLKLVPIKISFIIVGAQKGGTTALYSFLNSHPEIIMSNVKETNFFFTEARYSRKNNYKYYHKLFNHSIQSRIYGEASPGYMLRYEKVAPRIKEYNPNTKLIFILKNPIERAYSQYKMHVKKHKLNISFSEALDIAFNSGDEAIKIFDEKSGLSSETIKTYLLFGNYVDQIMGFMKYFKQEQMLFILTEELYYKHQQTMNIIYDFLEIRHVDSDHKIIHSNYGEGMDLYSKLRLKDYFSEDINKLGKLINKDVSHWLCV